MAFALFTPFLHLYHILIPHPDTAGSGGNPNGVLTARAGTKVWDTTTARWYINTDGATTWVVLGGLGVAPMLTGTTTPAADSDAGVHAGFAGNDVALDFPGPFTAMDVDRTPKCVFGAGWDGGDIVISSTSPLDAAQTETITNPGAGGGTVLGVKPIKAGTVISATKAAAGANPATCSIGRSHTYGLRNTLTAPVGVVTCDGVNDPTTWSTTYNSFQPTQIPNGARVFAYAHIG